MKKHLACRKAAAMAVSAAALLLWTPTASADDPPSQCAPNDQQCQDQEKAKQAAGQAQQAADQAKQAADQAKQAADQAKQGADQNKQGQKAIDMADKNCWLINGVPTMWTPELHTTVGETAEPCYSHFGLTPH